MSIQTYRFENDGWLPTVQPAEELVDPSPEEMVWFLKLHPTYFSDLLGLVCPSDPYRSRMFRAKNAMHDVAVGDCSSYGLNSFPMTFADGLLANLDRNWPTRPHDTILLADIGPDHVASSAPDAPQVTGPKRNASLIGVDNGYDPFDPEPVTPWLTARHGLGINMITLGGDVREARTLEALRKPLAPAYPECLRGGCTLCLDVQQLHYSFAKDRLYWWTGPAPSE